VTFDDFLPYVAPQVLSCPVDTVLHQIRLAAIEFCKRAPVWREDLDTLLADGFSSEYAMALDTEVELAKLLTVNVKDTPTSRACEADIIEPLTGREAKRRETVRLVAWTDERKKVSVWPAPRLDAQIDVYASLKPSMAAISFPDHVFAHHAEDIAEGALWRLKRMTGEGIAWADAVAAEGHRLVFNDRIATAAAQAERGFAKPRRRPHERYL
jgi:hypothetical protein